MGQQFDSDLSRPSDEDLLNTCLVVAHRRFRDKNSALPFATSGLCVDHASRQNFRSSKKVFLSKRYSHMRSQRSAGARAIQNLSLKPV